MSIDPVWSIAEHGPTAFLVANLKPLLEQYGAAFYINGHDHNLQHLNDNSTVDYIDCGPGHDYDTSNAHSSDVPAGSSKFFAAPTNGGFCHLAITDATSANVDLIDGGSGSVLHSVPKLNPRAHRLA